ncbi:MAG: bifunctional heptose 7-phosphate kinase/heptose 1-phosphate adenyltransferase [Candidatus Dormibacteria bacterium]
MPFILVVGDIIADVALHGSVSRLNPEGPGIVFDVERTEVSPGGAGAVAMLCRSLGADVMLVGNSHDDGWSEKVKLKLDAAGVVGFYTPVPTSKMNGKLRRFVDGRPLYDRIDFSAFEAPITLPTADAQAWPFVVVVADYGKGSMANGLTEIRDRWPRAQIIVDPARGVSWQRYRSADIIKCNRSESLEPGFDATCAKITIVTDGGNGMELRLNGENQIIPTKRLTPIDPTGCGDTVMAVLGVSMSKSMVVMEACRLANVAAGIQCQRAGVQPIRWEEIER